ncbi:MAG: AAA family ATPase [Patescibacteria group bacterium]
MRIVITGSHGVGKTTIMGQLLQYIKAEEVKSGFTNPSGSGDATLSKLFAGRQGYQSLPDAAIQAFENGFTISEKTSIETELWIIAKQIENETKFKDNWVADKCFIDLLAYAIFLFKDDRDLLDVLTRVAVTRMRKYDLVIYVPAGEFPIEDNGIRSLDPKFQLAIDRLIVLIMEKYKVPYERLTGNKEERFNQAIKLLR